MNDISPIKPGFFITLEGGEGCGKSTQSKLLLQAFEAAGLPCLLTREPGGTPAAERIRSLLVNAAPDGENWHPLAETLLFQAARVQHIETKLRPALARGMHVLCDRFIDSTRVYQGVAKGLSISAIDALHLQTTGKKGEGAFMPQLTLILDIPAEIGLARATARGVLENRFEQETLDFHHRLRDGYLALAAKESKRCAILDAQQSIQALHENIIRQIVENFALPLQPIREVA